MDWDSLLDDDSSSASLVEEEEDDGDCDEMANNSVEIVRRPLAMTRESRRQCRKRQLDVTSQCDVISSTTEIFRETTRKRSHCSIAGNYVWKSKVDSRPPKRASAKFLQSLRRQEDSLLREWVPTVGRAGPLACSIWTFVDHTYFRPIDACFSAHLLGLDTAEPLPRKLNRKSQRTLDDFVNSVRSTCPSMQPSFRFESNDPVFQNVPLGSRLKHRRGSNGGIVPFFIPRTNGDVQAHAICRIMPNLENLDAPATSENGGGIVRQHLHRRTSSNVMDSGQIFIEDDEAPPKSFHIHSDPQRGSTLVWQVNDDDQTGVGTELSKKQQDVFALKPPMLQILHWWCDSETINDGGESSSNACIESGERSIISEIEAAQKELRQITQQNAQVAQKLLNKVMGEEGRRVLTSTEEETMAKWTRMMQIAAEEKVAEQQKQEEDMNAVCYVCGGGDSPHNDPIIFCDRCDLAVHRSCYFLPAVPSGDWYCWPCKDQVVVGNADAIGHSLPAHDKGPPDVSCVLCPVRGGAYLPTDCHLHNNKNANSIPDGNAVDVTSGGGGSSSAPRRSWAHAACAGWAGLVPDEFAGGIVRCKQWLRDANYRNLAEGRRCTFCGGTKGAITKCSQNRCSTSYHVSCALKKHRDESGEGQTSHVMLKRDRRKWGCWSSLCSKHGSNHNLHLHNGISEDVKLSSSPSTQKLVPPPDNGTVSSYCRTRSSPLGVSTTAVAACPRDDPPPPPQREVHPLLLLTNTPVGGERLCQICSRSDPRGLWQCSGTPQRPCTIVVHWRCYRGSVKSSLLDDDEEEFPRFYCDSCQEYEVVDAVEEVDSVMMKSSHSCRSSSTAEAQQYRQCVLCPMRHGAFLRTSKGLWVHALCALCSVSARYVPPGPVDIPKLEPFVTTTGRSKVDAESSSPGSASSAAALPLEEEYHCQLCGLKGRPYIDLARCCYCTVKCDTFMHATCASSAGCSFPTSSCSSRLRAAKSQHGPTSQIKQGSLLSVLCPMHRWDEDGLPSQLRSLCELRHKVDDFPSTMKEKKMGVSSLLPKVVAPSDSNNNPHLNTKEMQHHISGIFLPFLDRWSRALIQLSWLSRTAVDEVDWRSTKNFLGPLQSLCLWQKATASGAQLRNIILNDGGGVTRQMGTLGAELGVLLSTSALGYFTVLLCHLPVSSILLIR